MMHHCIGCLRLLTCRVGQSSLGRSVVSAALLEDESLALFDGGQPGSHLNAQVMREHFCLAVESVQFVAVLFCDDVELGSALG